MEALAALRAQKKKEARLKAAAEEKARLKAEEEEMKLNGGSKKKKDSSAVQYEAADLAKAPNEVFAIGKDKAAGVWWKAPPVVDTLNIAEQLRERKRKEKAEKIANKYRMREEDYQRKLAAGIIVIPPEIETMETLQADKNLAKYCKMLSLGYNKDAVLDKLMNDKKLVDERVIDDDERSRLESIQRNRVRKVLEMELEEVPELPEIVDSDPESDDEEVSHDINWEVRRYRRDNVNSPWLFKGATFMGVLDKCQVIVEDLANDSQYCFSVRARDHRGWGLESPKSNIVMVESPLPSGWFRFFDEKRQRFYYTNLKTKQTSYTRPELDKWFLDESIVLNFADIEIKHLKDLYEEEIEHFKMVTLNQFMDCLREVGERLTKRTVQKLFKGYAFDSEKLTKWEHFMLIMDHIKRKRMTTLTDLANSDAALALSRQLAAALMNGNNAKMGEWVIKFNNTAGREFYFNTVTNQARWDMPDEVRFFIPPKLEEKMLKIFDFSHINTFKQHFAMLDVDSSGDLSDKEMKLFMKALNLNISDSVFNQLIKTIDLNGNGTIEFDEFCWMMYTMSQKEKKGVFEQIDFAATASNDGNKMMHGNHGHIDFEQVGRNLENLQKNRDAPDANSGRFNILATVTGTKKKANASQDDSRIQTPETQNVNEESKDHIDVKENLEESKEQIDEVKQVDVSLEKDSSSVTNLATGAEDDKVNVENGDNNSSSDSDSDDSHNEFKPGAGRKKRKPRKVKVKVNQIAAIEEEWEAREERLKKLAEKEKEMAEEKRKKDEAMYFDDGFEHSDDGDNDDNDDDEDDDKHSILIRTFCKCFIKQQPTKQKVERKKFEDTNEDNIHGKYCFCGCRSY